MLSDGSRGEESGNAKMIDRTRPARGTYKKLAKQPLNAGYRNTSLLHSGTNSAMETGRLALTWAGYMVFDKKGGHGRHGGFG